MYVGQVRGGLLDETKKEEKKNENEHKSSKNRKTRNVVPAFLVLRVTQAPFPNLVILYKSHYLLYFLVTAMYPRFLITLDEQLKPLAVTVRVGQAVDVVGQAGRPKTITGFQTHTTPVLLAFTERAELATEEYLSVGSVLEGFVVLKKNPSTLR